MKGRPEIMYCAYRSTASTMTVGGRRRDAIVDAALYVAVQLAVNATGSEHCDCDDDCDWPALIMLTAMGKAACHNLLPVHLEHNGCRY